MATLKELAGTTSDQFAIGKENVRIITGNSIPKTDVGNVGDIFISNYNQIEADEVFATYALLAAYTEQEAGEVYEVTTDETKNNKTTYYKCEAVTGGGLQNVYFATKELRGKVYIKDVQDSAIVWTEVGTGTGGETTIKYW